jgi:hypothetical protein
MTPGIKPWYLKWNKGYLFFISFAPPKEMKQRKRGPKCQLQPKRAPATQAFTRYRFGCSSHHFGVANAPWAIQFSLSFWWFLINLTFVFFLFL